MPEKMHQENAPIWQMSKQKIVDVEAVGSLHLNGRTLAELKIENIKHIKKCFPKDALGHFS